MSEQETVYEIECLGCDFEEEESSYTFALYLANEHASNEGHKVVTEEVERHGRGGE